MDMQLLRACLVEKKTESLRVLSPKKSLTVFNISACAAKWWISFTPRGFRVDRPTGKGRGGNSKEVSKGLNFEPARQQAANASKRREIYCDDVRKYYGRWFLCVQWIGE